MNKQKKNPTYKIGNRNFIFRELSLDEDDLVKPFFDVMNGEGNTITAPFTNSDIKKLLPIILEPDSKEIDKSPLTPELVGAIKLPELSRILADFFVQRLRQQDSMIQSFVTSTRKLLKSQKR